MGGDGDNPSLRQVGMRTNLCGTSGDGDDYLPWCSSPCKRWRRCWWWQVKSPSTTNISKLSLSIGRMSFLSASQPVVSNHWLSSLSCKWQLSTQSAPVSQHDHEHWSTAVCPGNVSAAVSFATSSTPVTLTGTHTLIHLHYWHQVYTDADLLDCMIILSISPHPLLFTAAP